MKEPTVSSRLIFSAVCTSTSLIYVGVIPSMYHNTSVQAVSANHLILPNSCKKPNSASAKTKPAVTPVTGKQNMTDLLRSLSCKYTTIKMTHNRFISAYHQYFLILISHSCSFRPNQNHRLWNSPRQVLPKGYYETCKGKNYEAWGSYNQKGYNKTCEGKTGEACYA